MASETKCVPVEPSMRCTRNVESVSPRREVAPSRVTRASGWLPTVMGLPDPVRAQPDEGDGAIAPALDGEADLIVADGPLARERVELDERIAVLAQAAPIARGMRCRRGDRQQQRRQARRPRAIAACHRCVVLQHCTEFRRTEAPEVKQLFA